MAFYNILKFYARGCWNPPKRQGEGPHIVVCLKLIIELLSTSGCHLRLQLKNAGWGFLELE
jgi:hypothetical protein